MISVKLPDGSERSLDDGSRGLDLAENISKSLAKKSVAMVLDGTLTDLTDPLHDGAVVEIVTRDDERALDLIRHDAAHVMAEAVQELYPGTQVTIGPVIEDGFFYDFARNEPFTLDDLPKIEAKMKEIIQRNERFTKQVWSREDTAKAFADLGEGYKVELLDAIPEGEDVNIYHQGDWYDMCRGPHMVSTGQIGQAFKLMKVAGAYWRGDSDNAMLTRIYGTAWNNEKDLKAYLTRLEEAEKRDHRKLGREMDLFHFQDEGPGSVFWHEKGWSLFQNLINYMRRRNDGADYDEVNTPDMLDRSLWEASGHWEKFGENMYTTTTPDERVFALKPMNCPGHVQVFKNGLKSYRDLPAKISEFGKVHRYEPSGALHGLMRVRSFTQDDAHVFVTDDQITQECLAIHNLLLSIYADFGFTDIRIKFSDRPEKRVGTDEVWDEAEAALKTAVEAAGDAYTLNPGEGAFYGPKLEYVLRDAIGRDWQCGTLQVDLNLPERLGAFYIGSDGEKHTPVMLHRAIFGSLERFTGILIEHHAGHFPLWLAPLQIMIATITSEADEYAVKVREAMRAAGLRVDADLRNEKINYKVREHSLGKVPAIIALGGREAEQGTVSIRRIGSKQQTVMTLEEAIESFVQEATPPDLARLKAK
ncbi:threonine--tRNA ligase [Pararhizobium sp. IMCC21322]|uniref:threonine--tRNA ligase n=1 Tax=Pararhizobium sp. IMCC21322 TaxID=3067903 RepID=UPI002740ED98|nr:threonine--tRNA ligase [Pararhizobium sp. IMCC21322]